MSAQVEQRELLEHSNEDAAALFFGFSAPPPYKPKPLTKPLCLPRLTWSDNSPFMRAYSDELRESGIEMDDWLKFVYVHVFTSHHLSLSWSDRGLP